MNNSKDSVSIQKYNCPSCGANLRLTSIRNGYIQCTFCGAQVALQGEFFSNIKNEEWKERDFKSGVPVSINRKDRHSLLVSTIARDTYFPADVLTETIVKKEEYIGIICYLINYEIIISRDGRRCTVNGRTMVCSNSDSTDFIVAMYPDMDQVKFKLKEQLDYPNEFTIYDCDILKSSATRNVSIKDISSNVFKNYPGYKVERINVSDNVFPVCLTYCDITLDYFGEEQHVYIRCDGNQILSNWLPHDANLQYRIERLQNEIRSTSQTIRREEVYYEEVPIETVEPVKKITKEKPSKAIDAALIITGIATKGALTPFVAGGIIANHNRRKTVEKTYVTKTKIQKLKKSRITTEVNPEYEELVEQLNELTNHITVLKNQYLSGERFLNGIYNISNKPFSSIGDDGYSYRLILENVGYDEDEVVKQIIEAFSISYRQAVKIIDNLPYSFTRDFNRADCDRIVNSLRDAGATVSIIQNKE